MNLILTWFYVNKNVSISTGKGYGTVLGWASRNIFVPAGSPFKAQWLPYLPPAWILKKFYVLPTQCIYVFCVDLRTNSDYFPTQH